MSPLARSIDRTSRLFNPWLCVVHVFPSSTDLYRPAVWVPAYAVEGCCGSKRTTHAPSTPAITRVQVAPESVLRNTPRPWVAIKRMAGWAGAAAIDHTGRSGVPGCCAPVEVQRVSAPLAVVAVMSNPTASVMGVNRTIWRVNLTRVPGKRSKDTRRSARLRRRFGRSVQLKGVIRENLDYNARRATALARAARCPAVAPGAAGPARLRPRLRTRPPAPGRRRHYLFSAGFDPAVCDLFSCGHRLSARHPAGSADLRTSSMDWFQGNVSTGGEHSGRLFLLTPDTGLGRGVDGDPVHRHRYRSLAAAPTGDAAPRANRFRHPVHHPAGVGDRVCQSLRWTPPRGPAGALVQAADRHRPGQALRRQCPGTNRCHIGGRGPGRHDLSLVHAQDFLGPDRGLSLRRGRRGPCHSLRPRLSTRFRTVPLPRWLCRRRPPTRAVIRAIHLPLRRRGRRDHDDPALVRRRSAGGMAGFAAGQRRRHPDPARAGHAAPARTDADPASTHPDA